MISNFYLDYLEDESGDLIDVIWFHRGCASDELKAKGAHPAPSFPDHPVYCGGCSERIEP